MARDVERIQALSIVPSILDLICSTTGMGFAAVARVTESRWITCAVRDEIGFGLVPGAELEVGTTICNEIRTHHQPVVIDDVGADATYCLHPTPEQYGFKSYASIPIFLKDGSFFGTLCAIDPSPHALKALKVETMFKLYADLIAYHLYSLDQADLMSDMLLKTRVKLLDAQEDVRQFMHVNRHTLREPLRKLQFFSDVISNDKTLPGNHSTRMAAIKINRLARSFSSMLTKLADLSETNLSYVEAVDLNKVLLSVIERLQPKIREVQAHFELGPLPVVRGNRAQLEELFFQLIENALIFGKEGQRVVVKILTASLGRREAQQLNRTDIDLSAYCGVCIEDNGIGISADYIGNIFNLFSQATSPLNDDHIGIGLTQVKRIVRNHDGFILVSSALGVGTSFTLVLQKVVINDKCPGESAEALDHHEISAP